MPDGTALPGMAAIDLDCGGQPVPHGYADAKGRFSIEIGRTLGGAFWDASVGDPNDVYAMSRLKGREQLDVNNTFQFNPRTLASCEIRASLPGYRSAGARLGARPAETNFDIGVLYLNHTAGVNGFTFSATTKAAPAAARKAYEKGVEAGLKGNHAAAQAQLEKATQLFPGFAVAWYDLGQALEAQDKPELARTAYARAAAADEHYVSPLVRLALMDSRASDWSQAAVHAAAVLACNSVDFPRMFLVHGVASQQTGDATGALESYRRYLALAPPDADTAQVRAQVALLEKRAAR